MPSWLIMPNWFARTILPLLLVAALVAGVTMSVAKAGDVTCTMGAAAQMAIPGQDGGDCGSGGHGTKAMACAVPCMIPALAVLTQTVPMRLHQASVPAPRAQPLLAGRLLSPDPHPPRFAIPG